MQTSGLIEEYSNVHIVLSIIGMGAIIGIRGNIPSKRKSFSLIRETAVQGFDHDVRR